MADYPFPNRLCPGSRPEPGVPKPLFEWRRQNNGRFDVAKDGRFLAPVALEQTGTVPITVVMNWPSLLRGGSFFNTRNGFASASWVRRNCRGVCSSMGRCAAGAWAKTVPAAR